MNLGWIIAIIIAALIIAGLAFYLGRLLMQIKQVEQAQQQQINKRNQKLSDDIYTIAWAMQQGQCEPSEGCLRIWVLLDHIELNPKPDHQQLYPGIFALYDKIKDLPTHSARKALPKKTLRQMDAQRFADEKALKTLIDADIHKIIEFFKPAEHSTTIKH